MGMLMLFGQKAQFRQFTYKQDSHFGGMKACFHAGAHCKGNFYKYFTFW